MTSPIPLTPPGSHWSQREYVACMQLNIGFAAHSYGYRQAFHYHFPDIGCTTIIVDNGEPVKFIYHEFKPGVDWISKCSAALPELPVGQRRIMHVG